MVVLYRSKVRIGKEADLEERLGTGRPPRTTLYRQRRLGMLPSGAVSAIWLPTVLNWKGHPGHAGQLRAFG